MDFLHLAGLRGGGQSTLVIPATPASTTHAQTVDQTGADLTRQLTPANAAHAQTAPPTAAALTKLAAAGSAAHTQTSEAPAAAVNKGALPADATHPHTAYETDLDALKTRTTNFVWFAGLRGGGLLAWAYAPVYPVSTTHDGAVEQTTAILDAGAIPTAATHAQTADSPAAGLSAGAVPVGTTHAQTTTAPHSAVTKQAAPESAAHNQQAVVSSATLSAVTTASAATHAQIVDTPGQTLTRPVSPVAAVHTQTVAVTTLDAPRTRTANFIWISGLRGGGLTALALPDYATDDAFHATTAESPAAGLSLDLAPTDVVGTQTVEEVGEVGLVASCLPANASHPSTTGTPAVGLDALVVPADATHAHRASTLHVDVGATASPEAADHSQVAQPAAALLDALATPADGVHEQTTTLTTAALTRTSVPASVTHAQTIEGSRLVITAGAVPADVTHVQTVGTSGVTTNPTDVTEVELRLVASSIRWHAGVVDDAVTARDASDGIYLTSLTPTEDTDLLTDSPVQATAVGNRAASLVRSSLLASSATPVGDRLPLLRTCEGRSRVLVIAPAGSTSLHGTSAASTALSLAQN